ncbi:hypothetical protein MAR_023074, partial [Mya arenaria]
MNRENNSLLVLLIVNIFTDFSVLATGIQLNGSAIQSSQYYNCSADKALNGEKIMYNETLPTCTCSVTQLKQFPRWWEMDFGSRHLIGSINVTGRSGEGGSLQSTNLTAFLSNNTMETNKSTVVYSSMEKTVGLYVTLEP